MAGPNAPILMADDGPGIVSPVDACLEGEPCRLVPAGDGRAARRPGRLVLAIAALALGIGSCQLPQPRMPDIPVGGIGNVRDVADAGAAPHAGAARA
jgi:hypothetical protein